MGLQSKLFRGNAALEACLTQNSRHVAEGAMGEHVSKIHSALFALDGLSVSPDELRTGRYGRSTAAAVLAFKRKRNIINFAYERQVDDIVGKMTIAALDREMLRREGQPRQLPHKSAYGVEFS
jgi:peptidoglycan hydrolase-like protein with peptidoglycan-binding domain